MSYATLAAALPAIVIGALGALWVSGQLNMLALGEQAATGLGLRTRRTRFIGLVAAALLCGGSVSIAGPIGFVGLVVPHIVKQFVPTDQRFIVPLSALYGAVALVISDIAARTILLPEEIATGIMTAILGGPAFVALVASKIR
jgi:iron complex transport system permease protein